MAALITGAGLIPCQTAALRAADVNFGGTVNLAAEFFVQHYGDQSGLSVGVLRYSALLGLWAGPNNSVPGRLLATLLGRDAQADAARFGP